MQIRLQHRKSYIIDTTPPTETEEAEVELAFTSQLHYRDSNSSMRSFVSYVSLYNNTVDVDIYHKVLYVKGAILKGNKKNDDPLKHSNAVILLNIMLKILLRKIL